MNATKYVDILSESLVPLYIESCSKHIYPIYQQDNDPKHTSKYTKEQLEYMLIPTLYWPPSSPDLNPIEHVWKLLKDKVNKRMPQNVYELEKYLVEEAKNIEITTINNLIDSMKNRLQEVINNNGDHIRY